VLVDQEYSHALPALQAAARACCAGAGAPLVFAEAPPRELEPEERCCQTAATCCGGDAGGGGLPGAAAARDEAGGGAPGCEYAVVGCGRWALPPGVPLSGCAFAWVGDSNAALLRLLMSLPLDARGATAACAQYAPGARTWADEAVQTQEAARLLKRRYYLVQRAREAPIVGIVAGTLGVAGYRGALERVRSLAERAGKKTYTLLVGKPNPAKLGNFPEVRGAAMGEAGAHTDAQALLPPPP